MGGASVAMFYVYMLGFDLLNIIGHCNFEFFPVAPPRRAAPRRFEASQPRPGGAGPRPPTAVLVGVG